MKQLVYIIASEYSGSTALDMLLSTLPGYVGFGEITNAFNRIASDGVKRPCSCGADAASCPVWSHVMEADLTDGNGGTLGRYRSFVAIANQQFGDSVTIVDSSKRLDTLLLLHKEFGARLKVIFLARDVRNYLSGRLHNPQVKLQISLQKFGTALGHMPVWLVELINWVRRNGRIALFLRRHGIGHLRMGFDELGADKDGMTRVLLNFLGERDAAFDFSYGTGAHHMLQGNKFFIHGGRNRGFDYSDSWRAHRFPTLCALALCLVGGMNRALVYSNTALQKNS